MDRDPTDFNRRRQGCLRLSSNEALAREKAREMERAAYRRSYWQRYAQKVKRVFGTLSPTEYREMKARADANDRSVWAQLRAEAQAYHQGDFLPTPEIERNQRQLLGEIRQIGEHLSLLVKLGHIQADGDGMLHAPDKDGVGAQTIKQMRMLETAMRRFLQAPIPRRPDQD